MIFYKVMKYTILSYCLDTFFNGVNKNFSASRFMSPNDVKAGMVFSKIVHPSGIVWDNCRILHTMENAARNEYRVTFEFSKTTAPFPYLRGDDGVESRVDSIRVKKNDISVFIT